MCFLADLLFQMQNFQKKLQRDAITIIDLIPEKIQKLIMLQETQTVGGWEGAFEKDFIRENNVFWGMKLWQKAQRGVKLHKFVTQKRDFKVVRHMSLEFLISFLQQRLQLDDNFVESMTRVAKFEASVDDIRQVHEKVAPDIDLAMLADQFDCQLEFNKDKYSIHSKNPKAILRKICATSCYNELTIVLSRILVCKPHSADCERLISAYNSIKSVSRCSQPRETISDYLYIHINMPSVSNFDVRPAACMWMNAKDRRSRQTPKASKQEWFAHTFEIESKQENETEEEKTILRKFY